MPNRPSIRQLSVLSLAVNLALAGSALALTAAKKCEIDKINAAKRREICLARHQKKEVKGKTPDFAGCERRFEADLVKATERAANKGAACQIDLARLFDISRKMYVECRGAGAPTVVFIAGLQDRLETWTRTLDPSEQALFPAIAATTRVCAYDRPGTVLIVGEDFEPSRSDAVPQPITLEHPVADLKALLAALGEPGPYVVVGHSAGGSFAKHYASENPQDVSGLVLVDYLPYELRNGLTDEQWEHWKALNTPLQEAIDEYPPLERLDHQRNLEQDSAAAPLKPLPLIVLSQDKPFNLQPFVEDGRLSAKEAEELVAVLMPAVLAARADLVSQVPGAKHITKTNSDHYIHREQPRLVINAVREVIDAVRRGCTDLTGC